jgi:diguanylate cyclase (GGDEF)-like protein
VGASTIALAALWAAGADPLPGVLAALGVAGSSGIARWSSAAAPAERAPDGEPSRQYVVAPAEARLPAGVADERLLDRLAVHEMTRARRYEHPLTLLLVQVDVWPLLQAEHGQRGALDRLSRLAIRIRRLLRDVDAIGLHGDGQLAILLPETPLDGAMVVAGRIEETAREDVGVRVRVGAAVFPDDAVTVEGLLVEAEAALELARLEGAGVAQRVQLR